MKCAGSMTANRHPPPGQGRSGPRAVRPAKLSDAVAILEISNDMGFECCGAEFHLHLGELIASTENEVFVAYAGDSIAGWIHVFVARRVGVNGFAEIGGLVTRKEFRRCGLGRLLVQQCETWAKTNHRARLRVRCNSRREGAHEFYRKIGFARLKDQVVYEKCP